MALLYGTAAAFRVPRVAQLVLVAFRGEIVSDINLRFKLLSMRHNKLLYAAQDGPTHKVTGM